MNRKELKKIYSLECKNTQWSWAFVNHAEKFIVVQVFQEQNKNKVYSPEWGNKIKHNHHMESIKSILI